MATTTRLLLTTVLALLSVAANAEQKNCTIDCLHDTKCVKGQANFTWHPLRDDTGEDFDFHKEIERDGYHCSCPPGLTGLRCGRKYESCNDGEHVCYNGGQCIATMKDIYQNDQQYCDCPSSVDDQGNTLRFSGKYCEVEIAVSGNRCGDAGQNPCQNGGTCKQTVDELDPCSCKEGYVGRMCEFFEPSVPKCSLHCQHGGSCRYGTKEEDHSLDSFSKEGGKTTSNVHVVHENYMYCECPSGYSGVHCETEEILCGDIKCRHGSTCVSVNNQDTKETTHHCDCNEINKKKLDKGDDVQFAGRHCEIQSTSVCRYDDDPLTSTFCAHNGTCPKEWHEHCTCPSGYHGAHCQFKIQSSKDNTDSNFLDPLSDPQPAGSLHQNQDVNPQTGTTPQTAAAAAHNTCRLQCKNGGHCRKGSKQDQHVQELVEKYGKQLDSMGGLEMSYNKDFEHCACPSGFVGIECEYSMTQCGENGEDHPCFHGSTCTMVNGVPTCVCSDADTKAAGIFCQHLANDVCNAKASTKNNNFLDDPVTNRGFCVNEGICVTNKDGEAACRCHSQFEGPHCEYNKNSTAVAATQATDSPNGSKQSSSSGLSGGAKFGIVLTVFMCVAVLGAGYHLYRKRLATGIEEVSPVYPDMDQNLALDDQSLRAAPVVDVGPEKDFDGNELRNVELL